MSTLSVTTINTANGTTDLTVTTGNTTPKGIVISSANGNVGIGNNTPASTLRVEGSISKSSGTFNIKHPDPEKVGWRLQHSFVESPTRGDNIYRFELTTTEANTSSIIQLPQYFKHLNENSQVWVSAQDNFGTAYGQVDSNSENIIVHTQEIGKYNVLLIGTRKDPDSLWFDASGVEYIG